MPHGFIPPEDDNDTDDASGTDERRPFDLRRLVPTVRPVKVQRLPNMTSGLVAYVGAVNLPVFDGPLLAPRNVLYLQPTPGLPLGAIVMGPGIELVALAVTLSFTPEDREWLRGMNISPDFVFIPQHVAERK